MKRRSFLSGLAAVLGAGGASSATSALGKQFNNAQFVELQRSAIAGFQYHDGEIVWEQLSEGDALDLVRESDNSHDERAVRVEWRGHKLGYAPRAENAAISHLLDNNQQVQAHIVALTESHNPWQRVQFAVRLAV